MTGVRRHPAAESAPGRPFEVFDVSVLGAADHVWLSVNSSQGSVFGVSRPLPAWPAEASEPVRWLSDAVRQARPEAGEQARQVGRILTDLVFAVPDVAAMLLQARGAAAAAGGQLLIRMLAAPREVATWPWELMTDPQRPDRFLTQARDVHVVRSARSRTYATRQAPIEPPMNLLMVMSSPLATGGAEDTAPFDLYEEKRSLLAELQPLVDRGLLYIEVEDRPTVERLRSRIGRQRRGFHLFHYLGHAQPAGIRLEQPDGRGRLVGSEEFARLLQQMPDLRLAVFAGCETARAPEGSDPTAWPGELSAADYCVRDACPMVIGMQAVLPFGTERLFTRFFYQALTGGQAVAEALRLARLAIADDEYTGGKLVNWAVPSMFVGGSLPGPVTDPTAAADPPRPVRRIGMRIGIQQGDLRFISRLSELRVCIDVLGGLGSTRLLQVVGPAGTGKTALLDRAIEELDPDVRYLFVSARRLLQARPDPVGELGSRLADLLKLSGLKPPARGELAAADWWERILDTTGDLRVALVIDDADSLSEPGGPAAELVAALGVLVERRSLVRLAVSCSQPIPAITEHLRPNQGAVVRLEPLGWPDVWAWIRRNLPVLTRLDEVELRRFYADLPHLQQWEQLADVVARRTTLGVADLPAVVAEIAESLSVEPAAAPAAPPVFGEGPPVFGEPVAARAAEPMRHALRVAVAGPFTEGRSRAFSRGMTQFAAEHQVGGRVMGTTGDSAGSLAELIVLPTAFDQGVADLRRLIAWLEAARAQAADVVVLDFGSDAPQAAIDAGIERLVADGRLVIAAGGLSGKPSYPAWNPRVLAIGALDPAGNVADYSPYLAGDGKPELYAPGQLTDSAVADLIGDPNAMGTSMAALYATAGAVAVWATDRDLTAAELRALLIGTAAPIDPAGDNGKRLDVPAALRQVRCNRILDILQWQAVELGQLVAESGLRSEVVLPLVDELIESGRLRRQRTGDTELIVDSQSLTMQYKQLRAEPAGRRRTLQMQRIVDQVKDLAEQGRFTAAKVDALWRGGDEAQRLTALAVIQAVPSLGEVSILVDGIGSSRSAFEQFQALTAARQALPGLGPDARTALTTALHDLADSPWLAEDGSRAELVRTLLTELAS